MIYANWGTYSFPMAPNSSSLGRPISLRLSLRVSWLRVDQGEGRLLVHT